MRPRHGLTTRSKSRLSVTGSSAALNALFRAKHLIDAGKNLQIGPALKTITGAERLRYEEFVVCSERNVNTAG